MEIVYCVDCGKKLREHDFVRGAAYTRNKQHFCTTCRPLDPQAVAPPAPAAPPKPKSTRFPAPRSQPKSPRAMIIAAIAAAAVLLVGVVLVFSGRQPTVPPEDIESAELAKRESAARDAVQRAKVFEASNPKNIDGQIQAWQKALPFCEKTAFAKEVRLSLDRAVAARETARDRAEAAKRALGPPPTAAWDFELLSEDVFGMRAPGVDQADGLAGKAARFNGKSYLRIDRAEIFNAPDITVSLWIKPTGIKGRQGLLSKRLDAKQSPIVLSLWDGALVFEAADETNQWPYQVRTIPLVKSGEWSHVALTFRTGRGAELYLNGAMVQEFKLDKRRCKNSDPLFIGRETYNGSDAHDGTAFYSGLLDELKVWIQPLSAAEIKAHYDSGLPKAKE